MRPDPDTPEAWLAYAHSDLALAAATVPGVMLETLCFHAQQAAEKSLKAVLIARDVHFPNTHSIKLLIELLPVEIQHPPALPDAVALTEGPRSNNIGILPCPLGRCRCRAVSPYDLEYACDRSSRQRPSIRRHNAHLIAARALGTQRCFVILAKSSLSLRTNISAYWLLPPASCNGRKKRSAGSSPGASPQFTRY